MLWQSRSFKVRNPRTGTIQRSFHPRTANTHPPITTNVAVRSKNRINGDSASNFHHMDEKSTGEIPLGISRSSTRNLPEEWLFCQELPAHGQTYPKLMLNRERLLKKM
jgi:hypothetical protein